jgi:hypothetical protein
MTTPPTPAGWYPDPDGSGGQRYWDGFSWTEHRYPAAPAPAAAAPAVSAPAEPVAHAEPVAPDPVASEEPTAIVRLPPAPSEGRVGAHRKPDSETDAEPESGSAPESFTPPPAPEHVPEPVPDSYTQKTEPVTQRFTPDVPPTAPPPSFEPFPPAPAFDTYAAEATPPSRNRGLFLGYGIACAALLAVLVAVAVYGFVIKKDPEVQISGSGTTTEASASEDSSADSTDSSSEPSETPTETPTTAGPTTVSPTGDGTDGPLSFTVHGIEIGPTVVMSDVPLEKTAEGEYIVVHMTVTNVGTDPATFVGMFQTLHAGGTTYPLDDEATAYLEGTFADLTPGQSADVSVAFDVPTGTPPESIELHADPSTPGADVPLS